MLDIIYGQTTNIIVKNELVDALKNIQLTGTLYIGYPVLSTANTKIDVDALLVCKEYGLVAFIFGNTTLSEENVEELLSQQDKLYIAIEKNLKNHETLLEKRTLGVEINIVSIVPSLDQLNLPDNSYFCTTDLVNTILEQFNGIDDYYLEHLSAAIQRVTNLKPRKDRLNANKSDSYGAILKKIEKEIANLDQYQKKAAIETPDGPQRIRGLAGSGKTIVLALKAAYLHTQHPNWDIVITFQSRSLYQQFEDLIRRFTFEHLGDEPDWNKLQIMHAWGGSNRDGVYTDIASYIDTVPRDFRYAMSKYGRDNAFNGICQELLKIISEDIAPKYDVVLIDEAQDMPIPFFRLVYSLTKDPKRIIWAYDELQTLSETVIPTTDILFGNNKMGNPNVELQNQDGEAKQDIVLPVCYRNSPWALTLAHSLGFGLNREDGLVQHFDVPDLWEEIGYQIVDGSLTFGSDVVLQRSSNSYPKYFEEFLDKEEAIITKMFDDKIEQAEWVARSIKKNLLEDELECDDILIIFPNAYTAKSNSKLLMDTLIKYDIGSHLVGATSSTDQMFYKDSIAIANIFRSKGNEAPMVYILDSDYCYSGSELITRRNILFTSITRSKAWVRICGIGEEMELLNNEIVCIKNADYKLKFKLPTLERLRELRKIHRDLTSSEKAKRTKVNQGLKLFIEAIKNGEMSVESLPPEIRKSLKELLD